MGSTHITLAGLGAALALAMAGCGGTSTDTYGPMVYPTTTVALADLNGDGKLDIVDTINYTTSDGSVPPSGWVSTRLQNATSPVSFQLPIQSNGGSNPAALAVARLSPTGNPGVVVANYGLSLAPVPVQPGAFGGAPTDGGVSVLFPDPAQAGGFLAPAQLYAGSYVPTGVAVADLNGDTYADVVVAGIDSSVQAGSGSGNLLVFYQQAPGGTFASPVSLALGGPATAVAIADLNGDGLPDLVATTRNGLVSVLIQNPDHTFQAHVDYAVGSNPVSLAVADLNGDGLPDIAVANYGTAAASTTQGLSLLFQNPAPAIPGTFAAAVTLDAGDAYSSCVAVGDLNGDGKPDIVLANAGQPGLPGSVSVFLQSASTPGTFAAPVLYGGVNGPTSVAIGDLNGDGLPDLAIGDGGLYVRFQLSSGGGVFDRPSAFYQ